MEELPDKNIFMMCPTLNREALTELPAGFYIRSCRREELGIWRGMPFDNPAEVKEYESFMMDFFETTYGGKETLFFTNTLFVCNQQDQPIGTCLLWKAYDAFNTIHWWKVLKDYEGRGIGRALLSTIMRDLEAEEYPIYLHTQPGSYRAIKLYSDFGFHLLSDEIIGTRQNDLVECLPMLEKYMPKKDFQKLKISKAPEYFLNTLQKFDSIQF